MRIFPQDLRIFPQNLRIFPQNLRVFPQNLRVPPANGSPIFAPTATFVTDITIIIAVINNFIGVNFIHPGDDVHFTPGSSTHLPLGLAMLYP